MDKFLKKSWFEVKSFAKELFDKDPMRIRPYLSYANQHKIHIKGRVLEDEGIIEMEENSTLDNLINNLKSFASDEAKYAKVIISYQEQIIETFTDDDGYFEVELDIEQEPTDGEFLEWDAAHIMTPNFKNEKGETVENTIGILMPHRDTEHVIVSDIDDTVLVTNVNSFLKLKMLYNTLFKNVHTRMPFEDISEVLHTLSLNKEGKKVNPIFYLSNSPWNLYDMLHNFLKLENIPMGPLFLRDFGLKFGDELKAFRNHKMNTLEHLLEFYKEQNFILIGDATESDTDIYLELFTKYSNRIDHIYIRGDKAKKNARVLEMIEKHPEAPIHLIEHSSDILKFQEKKHTH